MPAGKPLDGKAAADVVEALARQQVATLLADKPFDFMPRPSVIELMEAAFMLGIAYQFAGFQKAGVTAVKVQPDAGG